MHFELPSKPFLVNVVGQLANEEILLGGVIERFSHVVGLRLLGDGSSLSFSLALLWSDVLFFSLVLIVIR